MSGEYQGWEVGAREVFQDTAVNAAAVNLPWLSSGGHVACVKNIPAHTIHTYEVTLTMSKLLSKSCLSFSLVLSVSKSCA